MEPGQCWQGMHLVGCCTCMDCHKHLLLLVVVMSVRWSSSHFPHLHTSGALCAAEHRHHAPTAPQALQSRPPGVIRLHGCHMGSTHVVRVDPCICRGGSATTPHPHQKLYGLLQRMLSIRKASVLRLYSMLCMCMRHVGGTHTHISLCTHTPSLIAPSPMSQCAAVEPTTGRVAAGDVTGRILTWHDMNDALQRASGSGAVSSASLAPDAMSDGTAPAAAVDPPCTTVHWHSQPVGALCFSEDGVYLMSGT